jgi:hypothetical protein
VGLSGKPLHDLDNRVHVQRFREVRGEPCASRAFLILSLAEASDGDGGDMFFVGQLPEAPQQFEAVDLRHGQVG